MTNFVLPKLVIFDMDGTMIDTEPISLAGMIHAGKILGCAISQEIGESLMGKSNAVGREILLGHYGADFDIERAFALHKAYIDDYFEKHGVPAKAGIYPLLDKLESLGIKKCVATSTERERATYKLNEVNIAHRFEVIIGGNDVENGKPAPDIFLKAAAHCGVAPEDCIIIEDTEAGIQGAVSAGIRVIAVPDIAPLSEEIRAKATIICADLFEIARLFP